MCAPAISQRNEQPDILNHRKPKSWKENKVAHYNLRDNCGELFAQKK